MKTETISVRVTPEQKKKIRAEASALNMTVSDYLKNNGTKMGGPRTYREEVQKMVKLSEDLSSLAKRAEKDGVIELSEEIDKTVSIFNFLLKVVYESKDFQQYRG